MPRVFSGGEATSSHSSGFLGKASLLLVNFQHALECAEAEEAHQRRHEVERLYQFSRKLLGEGNVIQLMNAIPDYVVESFEAGAAALFLPQKDKFYRSGFGAAHLDEGKMKQAFSLDEISAEAQQGQYFIPIRLGVRS